MSGAWAKKGRRVALSRGEMARSLAAWLRGLGGGFRDHVAREREWLCEGCAGEEIIVRMRESDAIKLADQLAAAADVIEALASEPHPAVQAWA